MQVVQWLTVSFETSKLAHVSVLWDQLVDLH